MAQTGEVYYHGQMSQTSFHPGPGQSATQLRSDAAPVSGFASSSPPPSAPAQKTPFYKTRKFIICQIITWILAIVLIFVLLYPVVKAIAQLVVNRSVLNVEQARIISPSNGSFILNMTGVVTHTGIFSATIRFTRAMNVTWIDGPPDSGTKRPLGYMDLEPLHAKHKRAELNQQSRFFVTDQDAFGDFTAAMITRPNFTWLLESNNVAVRALKFPTSNGIKFRKVTTLPGINNFNGNVKLVDFQLPGDDPAGGISFLATTEMNNPSPFDVALGTAIFDLTYKGVALGRGTSTDTQLVPGPNNITLQGRLVPHTDAEELKQMGELFTTYLNGEAAPVVAKGVSTKQADGTDITWLSQGLQSLVIDVPFKAPEAVDPIRSIDIGYLNLNFTPETAWSPATSSNAVNAKMVLPFGFSVDISEISNEFSIVQDGKEVASLKTPESASKSDIKVVGPKLTEGTINITLDNSPLQVPQNAHPIFSSFNADLTNSDKSVFQLVGKARAVARLPIGQIVLDPIKFNVTSGLNGLQGLKDDTIVESVDVLGGTKDHLNLDLALTIHNPSSLNLNTGDLTLQLLKDGSVIGTTLLANLNLNMGNNSLKGAGAFTPNASPAGKQVLNDFVAGKTTEVQVAGYSGSTEVDSLLEAFKGLQLSTNLPGLESKLLESAALTVLPTTGHGNNIAHVTVALNNPFTAGLQIQRIRATVKSHGIDLGTIDSSAAFAAKGKSTTTSPAQNLNLNLDPSTIFTVTRDLALDAGLNTQQLDGIVQAGGYKYLTPAKATRDVYRGKRNIYTGFNLPSFVDKAFAQLKSDVSLSTDVLIGDYATTIEFTQEGLPTKTDESLHLLLPLLAQPIVQKLVSGSNLGLSTVMINDAGETSFKTDLKGSITNAGPFDAEIVFEKGLTISWAGKPLGHIAMPPVQLVGDVGATLDLTATFQVADVGHLTDFTKTLLTQESFEWEIAGENLTVNALGIAVSGINLPTKKVSLKGMNGLKNGVVINSFDLPSNDPAGGIHLTLDTTVTNPAQVGIALNGITFQNFYKSTRLGPATSVGEFNLLPQTAFKLALVGRLIPQEAQSGLDDVSQIFTDFIHGKSSDVLVRGDSAQPGVSWLNEGLKSLDIATVLPSQGPLEVLTSIDLHELTLRFTPETAFAPISSSKSTTAAFQLPFAFPLDIVAVQQDIHVGFGGSKDMAVLRIPKTPTKTDVQARVLSLSFADVAFSVNGGQQGNFEQFLASTTTSKTQTFGLSGQVTTTDALTAVGLLSLKDIPFDVTTSIEGLQGLNAKPALVRDLDVNHGFRDFLLIKENTELFNPSNVTIMSGDVSFGLQFNDHPIGSADISNLILVPGSANYSTDVHYAPQGANVPSGRLLLENFIQGITSLATIQGTTSATNVESLKLAFSKIALKAEIPALEQNLITSASLIFPENIAKTAIADTTFDLDNPFTAAINLLVIGANATYKGLFLGAIEHVDRHGNPVTAEGHTKITSPTLPLHFNLDPLAIIKLLSLRAAETGTSLGPLPALFQAVLANPRPDLPITSSVATGGPACNSGNQFDVNSAILNSLKGMKVQLDVDSTVALDEYVTDLAFVQKDVPAITDETALRLVGVVAPPIVQTLVDGSELKFSTANITNISDDGFDLGLVGSLTGTGPLDALITFVEPVDVAWQGRKIATIDLPPVCAAANTGVPEYRTSGKLSITDQAAFTEFATFLLHNEAFTWEISTSKLRVTALGSNFDNVALKKSVTLRAFNGLPGVTIHNFELPGDDPAGGITISTDSLIPSPAQLSINLGSVTFNSFFEGTLVGPLAASGLALEAQSTATTHLSGRILPQSGDNLDTIGKLFSDFLAGKNQTLGVTGVSVDPCSCGKEVTWLSTAFKTLTLQVVLPGQTFDIIESIDINDLEIIMMEDSQAFAPLTSSQHTLAQYRNPFGFSLQVTQSAQTLKISAHGVDAAQLVIPLSPVEAGVSTGNLAPLEISFDKLPLRSLNNAAFATFFALVTDTASVVAELSGTSNVVARTAIGLVPISGIPFDVQSTIKGINSFGHAVSISDVSVAGSGGAGGNQWITIPLTTHLTNPANISLETRDIDLPVFYKDVFVGRAEIKDFDLQPGANSVPAEFHYMPEDKNDTVAQSFLTQYLQTDDDVPLSIKGDSASTPFASLGPAISGITLDGTVKGIQGMIIKHIEVLISLDEVLVTNEVTVNFDVENPFDAELRIKFLQVDSGVDGTTYAQFSQAFDSFVIPPHGTENSGNVPHVLLPLGAIATLGIIPLGILDVSLASTSVIGPDGYTIPWLQYHQDAVPTTYNIALFGATMKTSDPQVLKSALQGARQRLQSTTEAESATETTDSPDATPTDDASQSTPTAPAEPDSTDAKPAPESKGDAESTTPVPASDDKAAPTSIPAIPTTSGPADS